MRLFLLALILSVYSCNLLAKTKLTGKLSMFEPFLGTWESTFSNGANDVSRWERALNGTALKTVHSINNGAYGGESIIFWDKKKQSLVFFYFTTAGFYTQGELEVISENQFVAYEDVTGNENGITRVKSTSTLGNNKITVSTSYFKQGKWTPEESRSYQRSDKTVLFK